MESLSSSEGAECPVSIFKIVSTYNKSFLNMCLSSKDKLHIVKVCLLPEWEVTLGHRSFCLQRIVGGNVGIHHSEGHWYCSFNKTLKMQECILTI